MVFAVGIPQSRIVGFARMATIFVTIAVRKETAKDAVFRVEDWEVTMQNDFDF
jgi:hypothetical protein|tara:strand:+ start:629 stop:787 length:159 start_codon:yes stop_codon:yes gene_type:complete